MIAYMFGGKSSNIFFLHVKKNNEINYNLMEKSIKDLIKVTQKNTDYSKEYTIKFSCYSVVDDEVIDMLG